MQERTFFFYLLIDSIQMKDALLILITVTVYIITTSNFIFFLAKCRFTVLYVFSALQTVKFYVTMLYVTKSS